MLFGELLPETAKAADKLAVLRGVNHGSGDHTKANHWMLTGYEGPAFNAADFRVQRRPSLGSATARLRGPARPGLPPYVAVPHLRGGTDNFFHYAAYLGGAADPFVVDSDPNTPGFRVADLSLAPELSLRRLEDRRSILEAMDRWRAAGERQAADHDAHYQRAFDLLLGDRVAGAFDVGAEPDRVARPLRPAHLRPERLAGAAAGRGGGATGDGLLRRAREQPAAPLGHALR